MIQKGIYWFRNNLRLHDNPSLVRAVASCEKLLLVYIFNSKLEQNHALGFENCGTFRKKFLLESVLELRENLRDIGSDLFIVKGEPATTIKLIADRYGITDIFATRELDFDELNDEMTLAEKLSLHLEFDQLLIDPHSLPFRADQLPVVFTDFRHAVEKQMSIRNTLPAPAQIDTLVIDDSLSFEAVVTHSAIDPKSAFPFAGGENSAWARLEDYFWNTGKLAFYKKTRNGLIGTDYSSKLSAFLALGCLSPVSVYHQVQKFEAEKIKNESTYWLIFELLWREFFKLTSWKYGNKIFTEGGIHQKNLSRRRDREAFFRWTQGRTGDDFVDANMIELKRTGFMSNRGRQNVASYLAHDLQIDWRWGAAWFESQLIDYDCASNWCNWMYAAGVGNDPRNRKFNTKLQADNYDPSGKYRNLWLLKDFF